MRNCRFAFGLNSYRIRDGRITFGSNPPSHPPPKICIIWAKIRIHSDQNGKNGKNQSSETVAATVVSVWQPHKEGHILVPIHGLLGMGNPMMTWPWRSKGQGQGHCLNGGKVLKLINESNKNWLHLSKTTWRFTKHLNKHMHRWFAIIEGLDKYFLTLVMKLYLEMPTMQANMIQ